MPAAILNAISSRESPQTVGISGYAGAGKTTLALEVVAALPSAAVVHGDDFLVRSRMSEVSDDWAGVDRQRLREQVLEPFRAGLPVEYDAYDWASDSLVRQALPACEVLVVEGIGLLHPSLSFDLAVWLDTDPATALARGVARDEALGFEIGDWPVWHETDLRFFDRFRPDLAADLNVEIGAD